MRPADVSVKGTFDILCGVNTIPKCGIRVEEDASNRYMYNIYCLWTCPESHSRALSYRKKVVNGYSIEVYNSNIPNIFISGDVIYLLPNGSSGVTDLLSEESCRNALRDFQVAEGDLKKTH
nr:hypothetical transcript [Hymenolepis microstoma]